jgi:hypothetical protein
VATNYPSGFDTYNEPSLPEETSLSSAGSATRNHTEHHRDLGDAVEALEVNAALKGHDHSGADDRVHGPKLVQANTHQSVDTDTSTSSIHHTIGTLATQAAAGNHIHDYNGGTIINKPLLICTSLTRPASPNFGLQIYETDTNRVRVWGQFGSRTPVPGLYGSDDFERTSTADLGPTLWHQFYVDANGDASNDTHGKMATPDGHAASWAISGSTTSRAIARRINDDDKETDTDDQILTFNIGGQATDSPLPLKKPSAFNDFYLRMSADEQSYWRVAWGWTWIDVWATTGGPAEEELLGSISRNNISAPNAIGVIQLIGRRANLYWGGNLVGAVTDGTLDTAKGEDNRGWGMGMTGLVKAGGSAQYRPANIASVVIQDVTSYQSIPRWTLLPVASVPTVRLYQGVSQNIQPSGSILEWRDEEEDNFDCFDVNNSLSEIVIKEPGLYSLDCSLSFSPAATGDRAEVILVINGADTPRQQRRYLAAGALSQTVDFSTKVRLDFNDRITIKCKHNRTGPWPTNSTKSADNYDSRLDLAFIAP